MEVVMDKVKRTVYSEEFKVEAIKMVLDGDDLVPTVADRLGIKASQLYNWMSSHRLPGEIKGMINKQKEYESEVKKLKRALANSEQEVSILKKALAYFAKEMK